MKAWQWHWAVVLLAAAMLIPAGVRAQETPPPPPEPPVWIGQTVENALAQAGRGLNQVFVTSSADEGWLGVSIREVNDAEARDAKLAKPAGVYVDTVQADGPAAKAGVKPHDIIVEYNGHAVEGVLQFRRLVTETPPGRSVAMRLWRAGRQQTLSAKVESRRMLLESSMPMTGRMRIERPFVMFRGFGLHPLLGVRAEEVSGQLGQYFQVPGGRGVLVVEVNTDSAAQKAGMKAGDVIYQVNGKPVGTTGELEQALRTDCSANGVSVGVVRKDVTLQLRVTIECPSEKTTSETVSSTR
ncbi:MAG: PDZ domain-containing protein [Acidobacteriota bacterium]|nr:PDZ domain-containing protein [Acidobacteriota bacterium]